MNPQRVAATFDLPAGTMLGKYEVLRKLAMGGMAEIYLARAKGTAGFEKLVVIKRILPTVAGDPTFVQMFLDEARLAATLQHPNIADVYEVGEHDGAPFFAMEFIHGQDVRGIRIAAGERKERVPLAIALAIIHGAASALDYAHDKAGSDGQPLGLVHRDVSSSNVLVSYEGAIKLIDFGIARATTRGHKTQTGTLKGKIPYMSPEQCKGLPLDRRSDLFSLGVIMYELTVGRRPFRGETDFAIMDQIVHKGAPRPSTALKNYPPELEAIVMKLLAPRAEDRFQTAEQMLHELDPFLATNRLWVSPKPLSRYMRTLFENQVAGWEQATAQGETLAQHLTKMTNPSGLSDFHTPPSSFPPVLPLSQEMPATRPPNDQLLLGGADTGEGPAVVPPPTGLEVTAAPVKARPVVEAWAEPPVIKRRGGGVLFAIVGVAALVGGAYGTYTLLSQSESKPAAQVEPPPVAAPVAAPEPVAPPEPVVAKPEQKPQRIAEPPKPEPAVAEEPKPEVKPAVHKAPPIRQKVAVHHSAPPPPPPPPPPKDKEKPKDKPPDKDIKDQKDPNWNSDSPFLPK